MRYGFTTGSCAAAAAKAAAYMLLTGKIKNCITIETPKGIPYTAEVTDIVRGESQVSCAVVKDGGDDPDVTSGSKICATVTADNRGDGEKELLQIDGGKGVGRVTRPGLDQPVGNAAINHVPREMITREVQEVCRICDFHGTLHILISVPDGEALAERTFNPRLGIVGGISILGTTGIVEPMSSQALKETIRVELRQQRFPVQQCSVLPEFCPLRQPVKQIVHVLSPVPNQQFRQCQLLPLCPAPFGGLLRLLLQPLCRRADPSGQLRGVDFPVLSGHLLVNCQNFFHLKPSLPLLFCLKPFLFFSGAFHPRVILQDCPPGQHSC